MKKYFVYLEAEDVDAVIESINSTQDYPEGSVTSKYCEPVELTGNRYGIVKDHVTASVINDRVAVELSITDFKRFDYEQND